MPEACREMGGRGRGGEPFVARDRWGRANLASTAEESGAARHVGGGHGGAVHEGGAGARPVGDRRNRATQPNDVDTGTAVHRRAAAAPRVRVGVVGVREAVLDAHHVLGPAARGKSGGTRAAAAASHRGDHGGNTDGGAAGAARGADSGEGGSVVARRADECDSALAHHVIEHLHKAAVVGVERRLAEAHVEDVAPGAYAVGERADHALARLHAVQARVADLEGDNLSAGRHAVEVRAVGVVRGHDGSHVRPVRPSVAHDGQDTAVLVHVDAKIHQGCAGRRRGARWAASEGSRERVPAPGPQNAQALSRTAWSWATGKGASALALRRSPSLVTGSTTARQWVPSWKRRQS